MKSISEKYTDRALTWIKGNAASLRAQQALLTSILNEPLPKSVFADIARSKSGEILLLQDAHATFERENRSTGNTARSLLQHTLKEQLDQTIELVLLALEPLYNSETIRIVHAGFSSGDSRHIANACEVLENLGKDPMISNLSDALQRSAGGHFEPGGQDFTSIDDVLNWCAEHGNSWLNECGKQAFHSLKPENTHG